MSNLDKKLDEVLDSMGSSYYPDHEYPESYEPQNIKLRNEALEEIKQAFIDDGWKRCTEVMGTHGHMLETDGQSHDIRPDLQVIDSGFAQTHSAAALKDVSNYLNTPKMTGQEWYDKFFKELGELDGEIAYSTKIGGFYSDVYGVWGKSIEEAAKKASGLK